jgi:hypothetical protein
MKLRGIVPPPRTRHFLEVVCGTGENRVKVEKGLAAASRHWRRASLAKNRLFFFSAR